MNKFSSYLKKKKPLLKNLVTDLSDVFEFVSVLGCDVSGTTYACIKDSINIRPSRFAQCGFVARVYDKGVYFEYSFSDIDAKSYETVKENIIETSKTNLTYAKVGADVMKEEELVKKFKRPDKGRVYTSEEIVDTLKDIAKKGFEASSKVINVRTFVDSLGYSKVYVSKSKDLEQFYTWNYGIASAVARDGGNIKSSYSGFGYTNLEDTIKNLYEEIGKTAKLAEEMLSSTLPKPGVYTIITDPSITGLFAHEAFGHGLEMDQFVKDRAKGKEYIGKRVAPNLLTMHDGAKSVVSSASYFFDDEGTLAQDTVIVKKGILQGGICDAVSGSILGYKPTGNGRRESYKRKVYTRMTNTFFSKDKSTLEDMIKSVKYGYYVSQTDNGMEDPKNWGIQCSAKYGREIVDGKFTGKIIAPVVMSGDVLDFLKSISMIANTEKIIGSGSCGKGYKEWVPVSDGGACLKAEVKIG